MRIAIVGTGISGLTAAYILNRNNDITVGVGFDLLFQLLFDFVPRLFVVRGLKVDCLDFWMFPKAVLRVVAVQFPNLDRRFAGAAASPNVLLIINKQLGRGAVWLKADVTG